MPFGIFFCFVCTVYVREYCIPVSVPLHRNKLTLTNRKSVSIRALFRCFFFGTAGDDTLLLHMNNDDDNQTVNERALCAHNAHTVPLYWILNFPYTLHEYCKPNFSPERCSLSNVCCYLYVFSYKIFCVFMCTPMNFSHRSASTGSDGFIIVLLYTQTDANGILFVWCLFFFYRMEHQQYMK